MARAFAVMYYSDGAVSLVNMLERLNIESSLQCWTYLRKKCKLRVLKSARGKQARRAAMRRKGYEDCKDSEGGVPYAHGAFDTDSPGPSTQLKK